MTEGWRGMDRERLDREYNARTTVPDITPFLERYAALSAEMRRALPCHLDVAYGPSEAEAMDIFPADPGAPVFVYIHGGYWRLLAKEDSAFMAGGFTAASTAVAALDYALAPAVTLDEIVRQVRAAIAWLWANGDEFGIDPHRIFVGGSSAGGHLVGMAVAGGWQERFGVPENVVKGGVALSGLFDVAPLRHCHVNDWLDLDAGADDRLSPIRNLPESGPPLIVSWGGSETAEFKRQSRDYAAAWQAAGFPVEAFEESARNHFDIVLDLADPESRLFARTRDMIAATGQEKAGLAPAG